MRTDATQWASQVQPKGEVKTLELLAGNLNKFNTGEIMQARIEKDTAGANIFRLELKGETLLVKGLPAAMAGKQAQFVARSIMQQGSVKTELLWLGSQKADFASVGKQKALSGNIHSGMQPASAQLQLPGQQAKNLSHGANLHIRIDKVEAQRMQLSLISTDGKKHPPLLLHSKAIPNARAGAMIHGTLIRSTSGEATLNIKSMHPPLSAERPMHSGMTHKSMPKAIMSAIDFGMNKGDKTLALVQKRLDQNMVQLRIQQHVVQAPAPAGVKAGDLLELQVQKASGEFQVVAHHKNVVRQASSLLRQQLPIAVSTPLSSSLGQLQNLTAATQLPAPLPSSEAIQSWLNGHAISRPDQINSEHISRLIRDSGTQLEARLLAHRNQPEAHEPPRHDLKAALQQLDTENQRATSRTISNEGFLQRIREASHQAVSRIEGHQLLNMLASLNNEAQRYEIPILIGQQLSTVTFSVESDQHGHQSQNGEQESAYNILFSLNLSGLGEVRIDARISATSVEARFYCHEDSARSFIQEHIQRLHERLHGLGFQELFLLASPTPPNQEKSERFDALKEMRPQSLSLLDLTI